MFAFFGIAVEPPPFSCHIAQSCTISSCFVSDMIQSRACVCVFQVDSAEAAMENHVTQISREDLEDLREAFNKIGQFFTYTHPQT